MERSAFALVSAVALLCHCSSSVPPADNSVDNSGDEADVSSQMSLVGIYKNTMGPDQTPLGGHVSLSLKANGSFTASFPKACGDDPAVPCTQVAVTGTYHANTQPCTQGGSACGKISFSVAPDGYTATNSDTKQATMDPGNPTLDQINQDIFGYQFSRKVTRCDENRGAHVTDVTVVSTLALAQQETGSTETLSLTSVREYDGVYTTMPEWMFNACDKLP
jgi:hypothetical protein